MPSLPRLWVSGRSCHVSIAAAVAAAFGSGASGSSATRFHTLLRQRPSLFGILPTALAGLPDIDAQFAKPAAVINASKCEIIATVQTDKYVGYRRNVFRGSQKVSKEYDCVL